jgi:hypothetical protein
LSKKNALFAKKINIFYRSGFELFGQFGNSPASSNTLSPNSVVGLADGDWPIVVTLGITLHNTAGNEHRFDYAHDGGFISARDICRTAERCCYLAVEFAVKGY